jgi:hypothetical protein
MDTPTFRVGAELIEAIAHAYHAGIPVMLEGRHGVGKSDVVKQAAELLGIDFISRDLSIMQPIDLVGMPQIDGTVTTFAPPAFLPTHGAGLMVFEELNRCPEYMRAPCLQLLTARTLNDYELPEGWGFAACVNPSDGQYQTDEMCIAMTSRFAQVRVVPDPLEWAKWAQGLGGVHPKIVDFVLKCPDVFESAESNPRAWTYASKLLSTAETKEMEPERIRKGMASLVGETWAASFHQYYTNGGLPLTAEQIVEEYHVARPTMSLWLETARLDLVLSSLASLQAYLRDESKYQEALVQEMKRSNLRAFLSDLPGDLKKQMRSWLRGHDRGKLTIPRGEAA